MIRTQASRRASAEGKWSVLVLVVLLACSLTSCGKIDSSSPAPAYVPSAPPAVDWTPRTKVPTVTLTDSEKQSLRLKALDDERESYGLEPFEYPALVRWIYPEELASVLVPCLADRGFVVSANASGTGVVGEVPSVQNKPFARAMLECKALYSVDPRAELPVYEREKGELIYEYWSEFLIPCLRERGQTIAALPSLEVFLTKPIALDGYPFGNADIEIQCPYAPPTAVLIGDA